MSTTPFINASTVAFITGGSKGIGRAIGVAVLAGGGKAFLTDIDQAAGQATESELTKQYGAGRVTFYKCDVANEAQLAVAFNTCMKVYGHMSLCVNNAGIGDHTQITDPKAELDEMPEDWRRIIDINLTAVINGTRLAYRSMRAHPALLPAGGGVIINIASLGGLMPQSYSAVYSSTKHAVVGHARSLAHLRRHGVRVNALSPGFTDTNLVSGGRSASTAFDAIINSATKGSGGLLTTDDIVDGALMLMNDVTLAGQVLSVSRELGVAMHPTPMVLRRSDDPKAPRVKHLPFTFVKELQAKL